MKIVTIISLLLLVGCESPFESCMKKEEKKCGVMPAVEEDILGALKHVNCRIEALELCTDKEKRSK